MRYLVNVGDRTVEVDLRGPTPVVEGQEVDAQLRPIPGTHLQHLMLGHRSHTVLARQLPEKGRWSIVVDGRPIEVEALDERTRTIRAMAGDPETAAEKVITAPMPGLVVRVGVAVGEVVTAGQGVVVVEAMKMENELKATGEGTVARIEVIPGQAVEKGATLIVLE